MPRPLVRLVLAVALAAASGGCRPDGPAPEGEGQEGSAETATSGVPDTPAIDPADLSGAPPPAIDEISTTCRVDDDCRVVQPGDWSAAVECCYDYPCTLDYVAVNTGWFDHNRAWQQANPFDCTAELAEQPCPTRSPRCGLSQDPPPVACDDGTCRIAWPEPWPVVDPDAQTCTVDDECVAFAHSRTSVDGRCCDDACFGQPVAVNRRTAEALTSWIERDAPTCDDALHDGTGCSPQDCAPWEPPPAHCDAGLCALLGGR